MKPWVAALLLGLVTAPGSQAAGQVLIRVGEPGRATYSELHEGLTPGSPTADSVRRLMQESDPQPVWKRVREALRGGAPWNDAPLALTRLAELRSPAYADSARALAASIEAGEVTAPTGRDPADLLSPLRAVQLERERERLGDAAVLSRLLALVPSGDYGIAEAWVLGRLGPAASDSLRARFLAAEEVEPKVRYLTLLTFSDDTASIPLLARVYAAPDSVGLPARYGSRASDALLWIGTRSSLQALLDARTRARSSGAYADPRLSRGGYDFLQNDSSAVISRTGKWLAEWIRELK